MMNHEGLLGLSRQQHFLSFPPMIGHFRKQKLDLLVHEFNGSFSSVVDRKLREK